MSNVIFNSVPIIRAFTEGKVMFEMKYGCKPEAAYVSPLIKRAIFKHLHTTNAIPATTAHLEFEGLPLYLLKSHKAEVHFVKSRILADGRQELMVQKTKLMPGFSSPFEKPMVLTSEAYDAADEAEMLTSETPFDDESLIEVPKKLQ
ncbi:MAG: hypothetical protein NC080_07330 [Paraprevotella sp.]|nr:hypothetical protein [Paraprevotella sp.]